MSLFLSTPAQAEWYVGGYGGGAFHSDQDIDISAQAFGLSAADTLKDVNFKSSAVFGGKIGHYFESLPQLGVELDISHFSADTDPQVVTTNLFPGGVSLGPSETSVTSIGVNGLGRLSLLQNRFQPYVGIGFGLFIADFEAIVLTQKDSDTDTQIGFQALVGARYFLTEPLAVFAEYKFVKTADFKFELKEGAVTGTVETSLLSNFLYAGVAYHF